MTKLSRIGFVGIGTMGEPMALNLVRAGMRVAIWNRSMGRCDALAHAGAIVAADINDLYAQCATVFLMLANGAATNAVLGRGTPEFAERVEGRTIVAMGTTPPGYSQDLAEDIRVAGGRYIEAPVSGSRKPAESGQLVAMVAGEACDLAAIRPLLAPMCREVFECGPVPGALRMKLAVNVFLITLVTGLAEATHFAASHGLDLDRFAAILDAGPMASDVSRIKAGKLVRRDFARQAGISDVLKNSRLVIEAAREAAIASPLMEVCYALYGETEGFGFGEDDMVAVIRAIEHRTGSVPQSS